MFLQTLQGFSSSFSVSFLILLQGAAIKLRPETSDTPGEPLSALPEHSNVVLVSFKTLREP